MFSAMQTRFVTTDQSWLPPPPQKKKNLRDSRWCETCCESIIKQSLFQEMPEHHWKKCVNLKGNICKVVIVNTRGGAVINPRICSVSCKYTGEKTNGIKMRKVAPLSKCQTSSESKWKRFNHRHRKSMPDNQYVFRSVTWI